MRVEQLVEVLVRTEIPDNVEAFYDAGVHPLVGHGKDAEEHALCVPASGGCEVICGATVALAEYVERNISYSPVVWAKSSICCGAVGPFWSVQEFRVSVGTGLDEGCHSFFLSVFEKRLGKKIPLAWVVVLVGAPLPGLIWKRLPTVRLMA